MIYFNKNTRKILFLKAINGIGSKNNKKDLKYFYWVVNKI